jgi:hypothetical protein
MLKCQQSIKFGYNFHGIAKPMDRRTDSSTRGDCLIAMRTETEEERRLRMEIGARLRQLCRAVNLADGLNQGEVGRAVGAEDAAWSLYVNGERWLPYPVAVALWKRFGAEPAWLLAGEERHNDPIFQRKLDELRRAPGNDKPQRGRPSSRTRR